MTRLALGVESDAPDDIEIGCSVWAPGYQDHGGIVGGCVIGVDHVAETVDVMVRCLTSSGPQTRTLAFDELDLAMTTFDTRNAGVVAGSVFSWLGTLTRKRDREKMNAGRWAALAAELQAIRDSRGTFTPRAQSRYETNREPMRREAAGDSLYAQGDKL